MATVRQRRDCCLVQPATVLNREKQEDRDENDGIV
jgi:hypothetical protein